MDKALLLHEYQKGIFHDYLVRSDFKNGDIKLQSWLFFHLVVVTESCADINRDSKSTSSVTGKSVDISHNSNYQTKYAIYLITSKKCEIQFVGHTMQTVLCRMDIHKFDISDFTEWSILAILMKVRIICISFMEKRKRQCKSFMQGNKTSI